MPNVLLAFITGLTTGGLSCLAVQGGLLASSLAQQIEKDLQDQSQAAMTEKKTRLRFRPRVALPIGLFLAAKLAAYTLLGVLLGALGSILQLNPISKAILLIAIGIFMIGNGLRMFNVHPIFRYFSIEPPSWLTRYIRRKAKTSTNLFAPLFLGALTILIPCGVTQAMMALAMATGSPMQAAAMMFAFVLGTSPVFFTVAYLATQLGARLEKYFMRFVATVVLILGLVSVNSGLNLMGSPLSVDNIVRSFRQPEQFTHVVPTILVVPTTFVKENLLQIKVMNGGYSPSVLEAKADVPTKLELVTNNTTSCATAFTIPALKIAVLLPKTGTQALDLPPQKAGTVMRFSCSMGMYTGQIAFKE